MDVADTDKSRSVMDSDDSGNRHQRISTFLGWNGDRLASQIGEHPKSDSCPMNKIEIPGMLNRRRWSVLRKAQIIGVVTGALVTVSIPVLHIIHTTTKPTDAATDYIDAAAILWRVASWPTWKICEPFGWKPFLYTERGLS